MITCLNCQSFKDPDCKVYKRQPPHSFAGKCKHYVVVESYVPTPPPVKKECGECERFSEGFCLRYDHDDFKYNFVKITDGISCPLENETK